MSALSCGNVAGVKCAWHVVVPKGLCAYVLKGNRKQFEHQEQVFESLVDAKESLEKPKYNRAKRVI